MLKSSMLYFLILIAIVILLIAPSCKTLFVPTYQGQKSDHYDGSKFFHPDGNQMGSFKKLMQYQLKNKRKKWTTVDKIEVDSQQIDSVVNDGIKYKQINHATVLVQHKGINILTDPVFSKRASPYEWLGPKRHRPPSIALKDLPKIDLVVISHDHYDHLDVKSLQYLSEVHQAKILVGLGTKAFLEKFKIYPVVEMDWKDELKFKDLKITFLPCLHWSNRAFSPFKTLWGSWLFESEDATIYFAGDTAYGEHFSAIKEEYGQIDLALIPIGAYVPRFFMQEVHMAPEDALQAHIDLNPRRSLSIHWGTFQLTGESMFDPVDELQVLMDSAKIDNFDYDRLHNQYYFLPNN